VVGLVVEEMQSSWLLNIARGRAQVILRAVRLPRMFGFFAVEGSVVTYFGRCDSRNSLVQEIERVRTFDFFGVGEWAVIYSDPCDIR
jgi:hypothetical protein